MKKAVLIFTLLVLVPVSFAGAKKARKDPALEYRLASLAYRQGNIEDALNRFTVFLKKFPDDPMVPSAQFMRAQCLFDKGKFKEASREFRKAISESRGDYSLTINALYRLAECEFNLGRHLEALDHFGQVRKGDNKNLRAEATYGIALSYLAVGELDKAKDALEELVLFYRGYGDKPSVVTPLGLIFLEKGDPGLALEQFSKAKNDLGCIYYSGIAYKELGKTLMATELFKQVLEKGPDTQWADKARYQIGETFFKSGQYPLASESFQNLLSNYPQSKYKEKAIYLMACSDFQQGKYGEAELKLQKLFNEFPKSPLVRYSNYLLGEIALKANDFPKALNNYSLAMEVGELRMYALFKAIWCHVHLDQYEEAIVKANKFLSTYEWGELSANILLLKGLSYQKMKKYEDAIVCYGEILDRFPNTSFYDKALYLAAACYYQLGEYAQLVTNIHQMLKNSLGSSTNWRAETYFMVGEAYYNLQRYDEAIKVYEIVAKHFPTAPLAGKAYQAMSSCYAHKAQYDDAYQAQEKALTRAQEAGETTDLSLLEMGNISFNRKDYEKAISYYEEFIRRSPENPKVPNALYQEGVALYRLEYFSEAIKRWERVAREYPTSEFAPQSLLQAGKTYFGLGKYDEALNTYRFLLDKYPTLEAKKDAVLQIGQCYYNQGKIQEAITQYEKFIRDYPQDENVPAVLEQLQMSYYRLGKSGKELEKLVEQFPKSRFMADVYWKMGAEAYNKKDYPLAQRYFQKIILDFPESTAAPQAFYYQAECYYLQGKYAEAISAYENFLLNFPQDKLSAQAMFRQAVCYFNMGDMEKSASAFRDFSIAYPQDPMAKEALLNIAVCYKKSQRLKQSIEAYMSFMSAYPDDEKIGFALLQIGSLYEIMEDYNNAVEFYSKVPGQSAEGGEAKFYLARCYEKLGMRDKEKEAYESLVNYRPEANEYRIAGLMRLAEMYEAEGEADKCLALYSDVVKNSKNADWAAVAKEKINALKVQGSPKASSKTQGKTSTK